MKKVLLVNPSNNFLAEIYPLGLLSIGTFLENNGHKVMILDLSLGHNIDLHLNAYNPDVIGITGLTPHVMRSYALSLEFRRRGIYTVIGGVHVSSLPEEALAYGDAVVIGDGEYTFLDLVENKKLGIFNGISLKNLDDIPFFNYELVDMEHYARIRKVQHNSIWSFVLPFDRVCATMFSRGCPYRCIYCHNSYAKIKIRYRSPNLVVDELKLLKEKYRIDAVHFVDDMFLMSKNKTEELCSLLEKEKLGIYFSCSARATDITSDSLEMLKNAGCLQIAFGFESASQRILDLLDKNAKVENNIDAIDLCNEYGIIIQGSFMFGNPTETLDEMNMTYNFINEHYVNGGIGTFITTPYPGTKLWEWGVENKVIPPKIRWDELSFHTTPIKLHDVDLNIFHPFFKKVLTLGDTLFRKREKDRVDLAKKHKLKIGG